MDWSDEKYVKLYTRDTMTWRSWPWQARAVFPSLMRKLDGAGLMPSGRLEMARAVAVMIEFPVEVVEVALAAMLEDGTIEQVNGGLLVPKFIEAQEARKNDRLRAAEYRGRARAVAKAAKPQHPPVTARHSASQPVTLQPSPAQPSPAQPEKTAGKKPPAVLGSGGTDPRHAPLVKALVDAVPGYAFDDGRDAKAVKTLLAKADAAGDPAASHAEVLLRWRRANARSDFPTVRAIHELAAHWPHFATAGPPGKGPVDAATQHHTRTGYVENFGEGP